MAQAEQRTKQVTSIQTVLRPVKEEVTRSVPNGVTLTLTPAEAQFIFNCTALSSGCGPYRESSNAVYYALKPFVDAEGYHTDRRGWSGNITHHAGDLKL